jgi:hypothetical protein
MLYKNGDIYIGNWSQDLKEGKGMIMYVDSQNYEGTWKNDLKDG